LLNYLKVGKYLLNIISTVSSNLVVSYEVNYIYFYVNDSILKNCSIQFL